MSPSPSRKFGSVMVAYLRDFRVQVVIMVGFFCLVLLSLPTLLSYFR